MKIQVFAKLKDFFKREFKIEVKISTIADLREYMGMVNPDAVQLLKLCRFAVHDEFVSDHYQLDGNEHVIVIPPSSGG